MKFRTFMRHIRDAFKSLFRNGWMSIASISAVALTLLLVGSFTGILLNVNKLASDVENDVSVILRQRRIGQQGRELIEGGDFRGAGTRQGFFDAIHYRIGQHASHWADYAVTVRLRGCLRVDFQGG